MLKRHGLERLKKLDPPVPIRRYERSRPGELVHLDVKKSGYVSKDFRVAVAEIRARHIRTRPYTPRTNGKAERFIQTMLREWAYGRPFHSSYRRRAALPAWLRRYNERRPHAGIGGAAPVTRLRSAA